MNYSPLSSQPLVLNRNRMKRIYQGGSQLDRWQGIEPASDGSYPEEYLISTIEVSTLARASGEGLSTVTLADGMVVPLNEVIASDPKAFLGAGHARVGVLARAGDPMQRMIIQVHPDTEFSRKYLNTPSGKTESWVFLGFREMQSETPHVYAGFKPGITRQKWEDLFIRQDIQGMLDAMHRIPVGQGDVFVIPAGTPHAIGPGALFLEVHEPNDFTLRLERNYPLYFHPAEGIQPRGPLSDDEIHYGIGFEKLFDCFHYETAPYNQFVAQTVKHPKLLRQTEGGVEYRLFSHTDTGGRFAVNKIMTSGIYEPMPWQGHRIAIIVKGSGALLYEGCHTPVLPTEHAPQQHVLLQGGMVGGAMQVVRQGQGVFIPAGVNGLRFEGEGMEVVIGFPPELVEEK